jgi:predicted transcriptional regulator
MKTHSSILRDRNKIALDSDDQVRQWTKHFGVTQHELARAIERVGNSAAVVRKELAAFRSAPEVK